MPGTEHISVPATEHIWALPTDGVAAPDVYVRLVHPSSAPASTEGPRPLPAAALLLAALLLFGIALAPRAEAEG